MRSARASIIVVVTVALAAGTWVPASAQAKGRRPSTLGRSGIECVLPPSTEANVTLDCPDEYAKTKFVKNAEGSKISFDFHATHDQMLGNVTVAQAKWIGNILSQLSDQQIGDAFRAANYSPEEIDMLTKTLRARINELVSLPD